MQELAGLGDALGLELRTHERQRDDRDEVRDRVEEKRGQPREPVEDAAKRLSCEEGRVLPRLVPAKRGGKLLVGHDVTKRRPLRDREEHEAAAVESDDGDDVGVPNVTERERRDEGRVRHAAHGVPRDHQPLAVPAVDEGARGERQNEERRGGGELDDPGLRRRAGQREDEERNRDPGDAGAEIREDLAAPEQVEVAVPAERNRLGGLFYRPNGLYGLGLVATRTLFVSR